jgi:hypothetical protein
MGRRGTAKARAGEAARKVEASRELCTQRFHARLGLYRAYGAWRSFREGRVSKKAAQRPVFPGVALG